MATTLFQLLWPATIPEGALDYVKVNERKLWGAFVELDAGQVDVYWTLDGTPTGTAIFGASPQAVSVLATDEDRRLWNQDLAWGAIWPPIVDWARNAYSWDTYDAGSNRWYTQLRVGGRVASNYHAGRGLLRLFYLGALGTD
jgi:hypothetical protein